MAVTAFANMDSIMLAPLESYIASGSQGLMSYLSGPIKAGATLYIVLYGYFLLKGTIQEPVMDFVFKCMKIVIITLLATQSSDYTYYVTDLFFQTLPDEIASALHASTHSGNPFDRIIQTSLDKGLAIWEVAPWGPSMVFHALMTAIILITGAFLCVVGFVISIYAKVGLTVILVIGPVFIALALFDSTRRFTEGWLGQLANFVILQILVVALGSLILDSLISLLSSVETAGEAATAAVTFAAYTLCSTYLFYQLPGVASALAAGGAALSYGYGSSRDVKDGVPSSAGRAAYRGAQWVGSKASYWAGRGAARMNNNTKK